MVQIIKCKKCGAIIDGKEFPECNEDIEWLDRISKLNTSQYTIGLEIEKNATLSTCICNNKHVITDSNLIGKGTEETSMKRVMTLNKYQECAMSTCMESSNNFIYMLSGLTGELGELNSKIAKAIRKENITIVNNDIIDYGQDEDLYTQLQYEIGDIAWFVAGLCHSFGWKLEDIANMNLDKLQQRKKANTIEGNGDGILNR